MNEEDTAAKHPTLEDTDTKHLLQSKEKPVKRECIICHLYY